MSRCGVLSNHNYKLSNHNYKNTLSLWKSIFPHKAWYKFSTWGFERWFRWNVSCSNRNEHMEEWRQIFVSTCWWLWRRRNANVFKGKKISNLSLHIHVSATMRNLGEARSRLGLVAGG